MSQTATRVYLGKKDAFPGWWVVGGCFTVLFFSSALGFYGMSVYLNAFSKELGWKISSLSIATTFFFLVGGITNMLVARLIAKFDVRILIYIGAVVGAGSLYMLGHVSEKWHLFVVYGVFAVAWSCSGLTTATTVVTRWFHTKRAPGIAAASSGLSMGGVVLTPIIKKLIDAKEMSGASPYLALIWFVGMCVPAYLLIRPDPLALNWMPDGQPKPENHISELPGVSLADATRTKFFWVVTIGYVLVMGSQVGAIQLLLLQRQFCLVQALYSDLLVAALFRNFHWQSSWCSLLSCKALQSFSLDKWKAPFHSCLQSASSAQWLATFS